MVMSNQEQVKPQYTSQQGIDAVISKYRRDEEKRAHMIRLEEDGSSMEATLSVSRVQTMPNDFQPKKTDLAFYFDASDGSEKFIKLALKWATPLYEDLKKAGGPVRVLIERKGTTIEDTEYRHTIIGGAVQ